MAERPVRFKHRVEYGVLRSAMFVTNLLPEWLAYRGVAALGRLFFRCSKRRQQVALRLLRNAYPDRPDDELLPIARTATGNIFKVALDVMRLGNCIKKNSYRDRVDLEDCRQSLPEPPFLGLTLHLGSWEVAAAGISMIANGADVVVQTFKNPLVQSWLETSRGGAGLVLHPRRGGIRGLARALASGRVGLQAVDQNQRLRGLFMPFFGELASTERAAATLAVRKGYPVVVGCAVRTGVGFRFRLDVDSPLQWEATGDRERDVENLILAINAKLEELVLKYPEQYLWIHDRYRTRPPSEAS